MNVTFTSSVIDKGTLYEQGQAYELADADAKRIQENTRPDIFVASATPVNSPVEAERTQVPSTPPTPQGAQPVATKTEGNA